MYIPKNLPKVFNINLPELRQGVEVTLRRHLTVEITEQLTSMFVSELGYRMIVDDPDQDMLYDPNSLKVIAELNLGFDLAFSVLRVLVKFVASPHIRQIENIRSIWMEHNKPDLQWGFSADDRHLKIYFNPTNPTIDIDALVEQAIATLQENNKPVPYKYLRALGRL